MAGKSTRLKAREVREVMRVVGEVREIGRDPIAWRTHAAHRLMQLTGGSVGMCIQARFSNSGPTIIVLADVGWESAGQKEVYYRWLASLEFPDDPYMVAMTDHGNTTFFGERRQFVDDTNWYPAPTVSDVRRMGNVDDCILSSVLLPDGSVNQFAMQRPWGAKHFTRHEAVLLSMFHHELELIWLAAARQQAPIDQLPDYLRRTFEKLLEGASEKDAAMQLGVRQSSLHSYVKQLHARLGVKKRSELITRFGSYNFAPRLGPPGS